MSSGLLDKIGHLNDARMYPAAGTSLIAKLESDCGIVLPSEHQAVLRQSNGVEVYAGYVRLFGIYTAMYADAVVWNQPDCWKFAWEGRCRGYWCFGETAWGDQYAYALESSLRGQIYFLDALSMTPQIVATSFAEFWRKEFVRQAQDPYDAMIQQARQTLGPLEATSHLIYSPSLLLGGAEDINNVQKMNARSAMICNGDVATQLDAGPCDKTVKSVQPYEDESHRLRLRLIWK